MPPVRTRDILNLSKDFYDQMSLIYESLREHKEIRQNGIFLDAVRRHIDYLQQEIRILKKEAPPEVLDASFQISPDTPGLNNDPTERIGPNMTTDDVLCLIFDFDAALGEFYQKIAESTDLEKVSRLFLTLMKSVNVEKEKLVVHKTALCPC